MKLKDYIKLCQDVNGEIVAFRYSFNGDTNEDNDIEDFSIGADNLRLEDLKFGMDTNGTVSQDWFTFKHDGDTIAVQALI